MNCNSQDCVLIGDSSNTKHHSFYDCHFGGAKRAIRTLKGSFQMYNCDISDMTDAGVVLGVPNESILLQNINSERCCRILRAEHPDPDKEDTRFLYPVSLITGRFDIAELTEDGQYIQFLNGGLLIIIGCSFEDWSHLLHAPRFQIAVGVMGHGSELVSHPGDDKQTSFCLDRLQK